MLNPGSVVGDPSRRYQIVRAIGRGGMGEVYEATQLSLGRRVALKTIREDLSERGDLLGRFRREAESAAALGHPNLVQVTDFQANPGEPPFLVMEMLDGTTLKDVLQQSGRLDPARAAFIGVQVLSGLAAAHREGIIHRDVKPGNLFLQSTTALRDLVKVLDFGVAKLALDSAPAGAVPMTRFGEVLGTLSYMAPEQGATGGTIDGRTDVYAVGATLFHALAGVRPFEATQPGGHRSPLIQIAPWVNRDLAAIVERALERSADRRWPSADAMAAALQAFAAPTGPARPPNDTARASSGWDPSAIGRLEAPTGGGTGHGTGYGTGYGTALPSPSFLNGATTPDAAPPAGAPRFSSYPSYAPPMVSGAAPAGAVPYLTPSAPPMPMAMPAQRMSMPHPQPYGFAAPFHGSSQVPPRASIPPRVWWIGGGVLLVLVAIALLPTVLAQLAFRRATDPSTIATNIDREVIKQPRPPCPVPDQCTLSRQANDLTYSLCTRKQPSVPYQPGEMVLAGAGADPHIALITAELSDRKYALRFLSVQKQESLADSAILGRVCTPGVSRPLPDR